jgi:Ca-activated chloride channel family protein
VLGGVAAHSPAQGYGAPLAPTEPGAPLVAPPHDPAAVGPTTTGDAYAYVPEQSFTAVAADPRSTFSIDVDTASYANVRKFLASGQLPPVDAVRIEELLNYFDYDYVSPPAGSPFAVSAEVGPCPWNANNRIVHVGIKGMELAQQQVPARNLVFLIDVSGSMGDADKLPLLKRSMAQLVEGMRAEDHVSMVVYAGASGVVLPPTSGQDKRRILRALDQLESGGSTNGGAGIELAYRLARRNFQAGAVNRVILATDGDFNVGATSHGELVRMIERERESGVFLSVLGFGRGNLNDETMEQLADKGNGNYAYIDSDREAHKVLVQEASGTLVTIAKDVKIQVEWNPATVASYRLIGYDNRKLAHEDFNDDRKDAGEIGAGHTVTALYEVVPAGAPGAAPGVDPLKYQAPLGATPAAGSGELMTVKLRYKRPDGDRSQLIAFPVRDTDRDLARTSDSFRFSAAVVAFGLLLRDSQHRGAANWELVDGLARGALGRDPSGHRREFLELANLAARMKGDPAPLATSYPADAVVYAH